MFDGRVEGVIIGEFTRGGLWTSGPEIKPFEPDQDKRLRA
jgi:hypothetical protein